MSGPVSIYISRRNNTRELLEQRTSEISPDCEKAIGLNQPDLKFRSDIAGSISLAIAMEHFRLAGNPEGDSPAGNTRKVVPPRVPPETAQDYEDGLKLLRRKERKLKAFDLLVKCLAGAYTAATGQRPTATNEQGYGKFWRLIEIVLAVTSEIAEAEGIRFPLPNSPSARAKQIQRLLKERKKRLSR